MFGVDVSVYSGEISPEKWKAIKAAGYELAVVGVWHGASTNGYAAQQLESARAAEMCLAAYVALAPGRSGAQQVDEGNKVVPGHLRGSLNFVAIDAELGGLTVAMIGDAIGRARELGYRPVIYTGRWWWVDHFGDPSDFADIPLWAAHYDSDPSVDTVPLYGGWGRDKLMGKQYKGSTLLHGVNVDLNWFDDAFIRQIQVPGPGEEEAMPTFTEEQEKRIAEIVSLSAPGLEMQARTAVAAPLLTALARVVEGAWAGLPAEMRNVREAAEFWHRWEDGD